MRVQVASTTRDMTIICEIDMRWRSLNVVQTSRCELIDPVARWGSAETRFAHEKDGSFIERSMRLSARSVWDDD